MGTQEEVTIANLEELSDYIQKSDDLKRPQTVVLFYGPMGAGKTQFIRYLVEQLGGEGVSSPSFAIHNSYKTKTLTVDHLDLYRLEGEEDLESIAFWDLFEQKNNLVLIEWSEKLHGFTPPLNWKAYLLKISINSDDSRKIIKSQQL